MAIFLEHSYDDLATYEEKQPYLLRLIALKRLFLTYDVAPTYARHTIASQHSVNYL